MSTMSTDFNALPTEEKLKFSLYAAVSQMSDDIGENNTLLGKFGVSVEAKKLITELMWNKMKLYVEDLEAFAAHAKRKDITCDDVRLLFRRNKKLLEQFDEIDKDDEEDEEDDEDEEDEDFSGPKVKRVCTANTNDDVIVIE